MISGVKGTSSYFCVAGLVLMLITSLSTLLSCSDIFRSMKMMECFIL